MKSNSGAVATGESRLLRPLNQEKFMKVCNPEFEVDYFCAVWGVPVPQLKYTGGSKRIYRHFYGYYSRPKERIRYSHPLLGIILHELAHHICHKQNLNGTGEHHGAAFASVLQEMIDTVL